MALFNNFVFKSTGLSLTSDADFVNAAAGTEFRKLTGEEFVKTSNGHLEKIQRTILSESEISNKYVNNNGDITLSGDFVPSANNSASLGLSANKFNHGYFSNLHATAIDLANDIIPSTTLQSNVGSVTKRLNEIYTNVLDVSQVNSGNVTVNNSLIPNTNNTGFVGVSGSRFNSGYINSLTSDNITINSTIVPDSNSGADVGTTALRFNNVYGNVFSGNAASASRTFSTQRDTNTTYYLSFVEGAASDNKAFSHDDQISVNPSTNTINCSNFNGNATSATSLQSTVKINNVNFNGTSNITVKASTTQGLTFTSAGGGGSGTLFNGSVAKTISYNTVGAPSTSGANANGTWGISVTGNSATSNLLQHTENAVTTITNPKGANYTGSSGVVGAIKIRLPQSWSNTMMTMKVRVFDYQTMNSFEYIISGYNHTGSQWVNCSVGVTGGNDINHTVRFGHDGTACCVFIGEINTTFTWAKVSVVDFQAGHQNYSISKWSSGWSISQVTATTNVSKTITPVQRMGSNSSGGYWGLSTPTGDSNDWVRTTTNGLIPSSSGGASQLGNSTWMFNKTYSTVFHHSQSAYISTGASNSSRISSPSGYVDIGAQNNSYLHLYTDRPSFYFNKQIYVLGAKVVHSNTGIGVGGYVFLRNLRGSTVYAGSNYYGNALYYGGTWHSTSTWYNTPIGASKLFKCCGVAAHNQMTVFQRIL